MLLQGLTYRYRLLSLTERQHQLKSTYTIKLNYHTKSTYNNK